jgi:predicted ATPase
VGGLTGYQGLPTEGYQEDMELQEDNSMLQLNDLENRKLFFYQSIVINNLKLLFCDEFQCNDGSDMMINENLID